jgi:transketolase
VIETMRDRFHGVLSRALDEDPRIAVVLADIGAGAMASARARHPDRVINVGIREQLMVSAAGGLALAGFRAVASSYAPFVVERPYEQVKLDFGHQGVGGVLVSVGASYDWAAGGRTHQCPEDVVLMAALPGWRVLVPGHADEAEALLRHALASDDRVYLRLTEQSNLLPRPIQPGRLTLVKRGPRGTVIAVGPLLDATIQATADLDVTVLYATTVRPFDAGTLRSTLGAPDVVLVEPYLAGTSSAEVSRALSGVRHRVLGLGVANEEHRHYGNWAEHNAAHGLDSRGLRTRIGAFLAA